MDTHQGVHVMDTHQGVHVIDTHKSVYVINTHKSVQEMDAYIINFLQKNKSKSCLIIIKSQLSSVLHIDDN